MASGKTLLAWDFPPRTYRVLNHKLEEFLKSKGLHPLDPHAKWPHISIALIDKPSEEERNKLMLGGPAVNVSFTMIGLEIFSGNPDPKTPPPVDFIVVTMKPNSNAADKLRAFITDLVGDRFRPFPGAYKPHASVITIPKTERAEAEALLPEMLKIAKRSFTRFKPEQIQLWDDFEISEIDTNQLL